MYSVETSLPGSSLTHHHNHCYYVGLYSIWNILNMNIILKLKCNNQDDM